MQEKKDKLKKTMIETKDLDVYRKDFSKLLDLVGGRDGKENS